MMAQEQAKTRDVSFHDTVMSSRDNSVTCPEEYAIALEALRWEVLSGMNEDGLEGGLS